MIVLQLFTRRHTLEDGNYRIYISNGLGGRDTPRTDPISVASAISEAADYIKTLYSEAIDSRPKKKRRYDEVREPQEQDPPLQRNGSDILLVEDMVPVTQSQPVHLPTPSRDSQLRPLLPLPSNTAGSESSRLSPTNSHRGSPRQTAPPLPHSQTPLPSAPGMTRAIASLMKSKDIPSLASLLR